MLRKEWRYGMHLIVLATLDHGILKISQFLSIP
jgi:hypothetical protein